MTRPKIGKDTDRTANSSRAKWRLSFAEWLGVVQLFMLIITSVASGFVFLKYDARDKTLAREKTEIELRKLRAAPLSFVQDISISEYGCDRGKGPPNLGVNYHYSITNTTSKKVKIVLVVLRTAILPTQTIGETGAVEFPQITFSADSPWRKIFTKAYLADGEELEADVVESEFGEVIVPTRDGGPTGEIDPGDTAWDTLSLIVGSRNYGCIGFGIDVYVRFEDNTDRWVCAHQYAELTPSENDGAPKSASISDKDMSDK